MVKTYLGYKSERNPAAPKLMAMAHAVPYAASQSTAEIIPSFITHRFTMRQREAFRCKEERYWAHSRRVRYGKEEQEECNYASARVARVVTAVDQKGERPSKHRQEHHRNGEEKPLAAPQCVKTSSQGDWKTEKKVDGT